MRVKLSKISTENNSLGWDTIFLIKKTLSQREELIEPGFEDSNKTTLYHYEYLAIGDGELVLILEEDLIYSAEAYKAEISVEAGE